MHFSPQQRDDWATNTRDSDFNRWLRDQVNNTDGTLDLERLYQLAERYGIDARGRYCHLNPGQQRMNVGNRLRRIVPQHEYARRKLEPNPSPEAPASEASAKAAEDDARTLLTPVSTRDLVRRYGEILDELKRRAVIRTLNSPVGDYSEYLFAKAFGWELQANSTSGYDATDKEGIRYQVKWRRVHSATKGSRQLSAFRGLRDGKFDVLAGVLFNKQFGVERAALVPHALVLSRSSYIQHVNGWRFSLEDLIWDIPGVRDVTAQLRAVERLA